jgi:hypothetical protein
MIEKATLEEKIEDLSRRLSRLESNVVRNYGPITAEPATKPLPPAGWPFPSVGATSRCGECGITLSPVMGYVCARSHCPSGLGGVSCTVQSNMTTEQHHVHVGSGATLAKVFGHGGPFGEDGALLAQGYSECQ